MPMATTLTNYNFYNIDKKLTNFSICLDFIIKELWYMHHITAAMFVIFFIVHIFFLLLPANRYLISSMFTGRLSKEKAAEKHSKWNYEK